MRKILLLIAFLISCFVPCYAAGDGIGVSHRDGIYIFEIPLKKYADKIKPYVAPKLTTVSDVFNDKDLNFKLVVNGGFFNTITGAPVSDVIIDKKEVESLFSNLALIESLNKQNRIEKVINRTELRVLEDVKGNLVFDIAEHNAEPAGNTELIHSIQAGPMLLPKFRLEEESFIKYNGRKLVDLAADVTKRRERTIIGLKDGFFGNDYLYIIIFTNKHKATMKEARDYCKGLHLTKAMGFDGGASTSINYKDIEVISSYSNTRKVKSFLVIENEKEEKIKDKETSDLQSEDKQWKK